jgi:hypothetical protein
MTIPNILVGCGGSGLKTLRRVAKLLAEDPDWRQRMVREISFFLVDTDLSELKEFESEIQSLFPVAESRPLVRKIHLSSGIGRLQPLIEQKMNAPFNGQPDHKGRKRLLNHWWNRDNQLFDGSGISHALNVGAGQCPPVSFFLTWYQEKMIDQEIDETIAEVGKRNGGLLGVDGVNVILVTGLAGGTGRGSWNLISYKFREAFRNKGMAITPQPLAVLYDSSVFPNVMRKFPDQAIPMRINSLTGLSELSCWVKNRRDTVAATEEPYIYRLPSLTKPDNEGSDFVIAELRMNRNEAAPVDHVYVCFGENINHRLGDSSAYFDVFGTAIYGMITASSIKRHAINSNFDYNSLGAISYEINAVSIRRFFESRIREQFVQKLISSDEEAARNSEESVLKDLEIQSDKLVRLFARKIENDPKIRQAFGQIRQIAVNEQDLERVKQAIERTINHPEGAKIVKEMVDKTFKEIGGDLQKKINDQSLNIFKQTFSLGTIRRFLERIRGTLRNIQAEFVSEGSRSVLNQQGSKDNPQELAESLSGRRFFGLMKPFEDHEIAEIEESIKSQYVFFYREQLTKEIGASFDKLVRIVKSLDSKVENMIFVSSTLKKKYENQVKSLSGRKDSSSSEDVFNELFASSSEPQKAIPSAFNANQFARREVKPIYSPEEELEDLATEGRWGGGNDGTANEIQQWFKNELESTSGQSDREHENNLQDTLDKIINENIGISHDFVVRKFSLLNCLPKIFEAWSQKIEKEKNQDRRETLQNQFQTFFGFRIELENERTKPVSIDKAVANMASSIARSCLPYWILKKPGQNLPQVDLFFRAQDENRAMNALTKKKKPEETWTPHINKHDNPFVFLAVTNQGVETLDDLQSTQYFQEAEIVNEIKKVESPHGLLVFDRSRGSNGGLGLVDPSYVNDEKLKKMRWRPWAESSVEQQADQEFQVLKALFYGLFGNQWLDEGPSKEVDWLEKFNQRNWQLPLIKRMKQGRFECQREFRRLNGSEAVPDMRPVDGWITGENLAQGIARVFQTLEKNDNIRNRILEEYDLFWNSILPKLDVSHTGTAWNSILLDYQKWLDKCLRAERTNADNKKTWTDILTFASKI